MADCNSCSHFHTHHSYACTSNMNFDASISKYFKLTAIAFDFPQKDTTIGDLASSNLGILE